MVLADHTAQFFSWTIAIPAMQLARPGIVQARRGGWFAPIEGVGGFPVEVQGAVAVPEVSD